MLVGHNWQHSNKPIAHIVPKSVTNTTAAGDWIVEPWKLANQLTFLFMGGAWAATVDGSAVIQGRKRSDGSAVTLKEKDGVTNLALTATYLDDAGAGENGLIPGTIPLEDIDSETYDAVRMLYTEAGNAAALICVVAILSGFKERPSGTTDDLFSKAHQLAD